MLLLFQYLDRKEGAELLCRASKMSILLANHSGFCEARPPSPPAARVPGASP